MRKKNFIPKDYVAPEMEVIDIETEQCFAESRSEIDELTEMDWEW